MSESIEETASIPVFRWVSVRHVDLNHPDTYLRSEWPEGRRDFYQRAILQARCPFCHAGPTAGYEVVEMADMGEESRGGECHFCGFGWAESCSPCFGLEVAFHHSLIHRVLCELKDEDAGKALDTFGGSPKLNSLLASVSKLEEVTANLNPILAGLGYQLTSTAVSAATSDRHELLLFVNQAGAPVLIDVEFHVSPPWLIIAAPRRILGVHCPPRQKSATLLAHGGWTMYSPDFKLKPSTGMDFTASLDAVETLARQLGICQRGESFQQILKRE